MSRYKVCIPCEGPVSQEFGTSPLDEHGAPYYGNSWTMHLGIDIAVPESTPVRAARTGRVLWAEEWGALGLCVVLGHSDHSRTEYCHLSRLFAVPGQRIRAGRQLGLSGNTGMSEGPHLHLGLWLHGTWETGDPYQLTRDDPTALPADPWAVWQGRWPTVGVHQVGFSPM